MHGPEPRHNALDRLLWNVVADTRAHLLLMALFLLAVPVFGLATLYSTGTSLLWIIPINIACGLCAVLVHQAADRWRAWQEWVTSKPPPPPTITHVIEGLIRRDRGRK